MRSLAHTPDEECYFINWSLMAEAFLCGGVRTPIGRYGGSLSSVRADDLAAFVLKQIMTRFPYVQWDSLDDVILGCANQAGEDNRNVGRMAVLLAGLPDGVTGSTVNRLCGSGLDAVGTAARAIRAGEADLVIAGGVESMSRAPFVVPKADTSFSRAATIYDTTIGWRFINPKLQQTYGTDSMPETGQNVATEFKVSRHDQDAFALRSQQRAANAQSNGRFAKEIVPIPVAQKKGDPLLVSQDEHPRQTSIEALSKLKSVVGPNGTITAGNASGVNDGAAALLIASEDAVSRFDLKPVARILGMTTAGVPPRIMGVGPAPATKKLLERHSLKIGQIDVMELNEAFASQALAVLRILGISDDAEHVNPNGGAIALGHPLGMSGARLALTSALELQERTARFAVATMCIGVGQGIAVLLGAP
jgi:3-oxoadipyl-CoA thiolase